MERKTELCPSWTHAGKEIGMDGIAKSTLPYFLGMDLADLSEGVPLSEEGGIVDFMTEARKLAAAAEDAGICLRKTKDQRSRALFLMRGFYLLGVFRGGEAARAILLDEEAEGGRFVLSRACAQLFLEELSGLSSFLLEANCKAIGL